MTHDEQNNSSDTGTKVPMTHDELLAKINAPLGEFDAGNPTRHHLLLAHNKALRAVAKLHKPTDWHPGCAQCGYYEYPCPTIKAIERELK